jgi:hypothetical protein
MRVFGKIKHLGNYPSQREYTGEPAVLVVATSTLSVYITGVPLEYQAKMQEYPGTLGNQKCLCSRSVGE